MQSFPNNAEQRVPIHPEWVEIMLHALNQIEASDERRKVYLAILDGFQDDGYFYKTHFREVFGQDSEMAPRLDDLLSSISWYTTRMNFALQRADVPLTIRATSYISDSGRVFRHYFDGDASEPPEKNLRARRKETARQLREQATMLLAEAAHLSEQAADLNARAASIDTDD